MTTNDPNHPNETLTCTGRILQPLHMTPARVNFGNIARNSATQYKTITLTRGDGGPITPTVGRPAKTAGLDAQICEVEPGDHYELELSVGPPWPQGGFKDILTINTGLDIAPEITLLVTGTVAQRLTARPTRLDLPVERAEAMESRVDLNWSDGSPGRILEATCSIPESTVRVEEEDGKQVLVLTVPAGSEGIAGRHQITIKTDDSEVPTYSIPVQFRQQRGARALPSGKTITPKRIPGPVPSKASPVATPPKD